MPDVNKKLAAKKFVARWQAAEGNEQREANSFWIELCHDVLGMPDPTHVLEFERMVNGRRIDVFYEDMGILIENKSRGVDLDKRYQRGKYEGGEARMVTPFEQAKWYADAMPASVRPRWIIVCNFDQIRIHDLNLENPASDYVEIRLDELSEKLHLLSFFTDKRGSRLEVEAKLSVQAGGLVGNIYDALAKQYLSIETDEREQRSLNVLVTRLVFLLYAEDAGLLQRKDAFLEFLRKTEPEDMRGQLKDLFRTLDTPAQKRDPYLKPSLAEFPYVNGGLFADEEIVIPQFTPDIKHELLGEASQGFDWSGISPTIFGAAFESTLNPETRRAGGMHYTSVENIHKVIDPLFLDDLKAELAEIEGESVERQRNAKLRRFQLKLSQLKFLDPACGSGNFLTETYVSLRKLELRVVEDLQGDQTAMGFSNPIMVNIGQFYGVEINDFAVSVAKTALWIAEQQMMERTQELLPLEVFEFLPLKSISGIREANALRIDWNDVLPAEECSYVIGNPPFLGARNQTKEQKAEVAESFGHAKNSGNIDYVAAWYAKAADYIAGYPVRCAFVSTNSICQGEQVANIWKPLWDAGIRIDFAHDTFRWRNEATGQAHVFVVIVGFSRHVDEAVADEEGSGKGAADAAGAGANNGDGAVAAKTATASPGEQRSKRLFHHAGPDEPAVEQRVANINAYLLDAPDAFVWNRASALCDVPKISIGSQPIDGGNYLFKDDEKAEFVFKEPASEKHFHRWLGSNEFLNGKPRWVLWLGDCSTSELDGLPNCRERVKAVRQFRESSKRAQTKKAASTPNHFGTEIIAKGTSILIPKVSSERRFYIPLGFIGPDTFCSDLVFLVPNATLYHFGVLHSQMHNAWMRTVCGRLKSDYRYSGGMVYNNFVWPGVRTAADLQIPVEELVPAAVRARIEQTAQGILDARAAHPGSTLAQLYSPDDMPSDLRTAHEANDAAVEAAYNVDFRGNEAKIVAHLFDLYARLAG